MSTFPLRSAIAAVCAVALASSTGIAQTAPTALAPRDPAPSVSTPAELVPSALQPEAVTASLVVPPSAMIPAMLAPTLEPPHAGSPIGENISAAMRRREAFSRPQVLMITGGALLLTGLLVDGDASSILIIAGAGIGGYGLYLYLQTPNARFDR